MMVLAALVQYAEDDSAIAALVASRVWPLGSMPSDPVWPNIVVSQVGAEPQRHLLGGSELVQALYQFDCWGESTGDVEQLADAVRKRFDNRRHLDLPSPVGTFRVQSMTLQNVQARFEPPLEGSDQAKLGRQLDIDVWYNETATPT